jgi:hypothetical protein
MRRDASWAGQDRTADRDTALRSRGSRRRSDTSRMEWRDYLVVRTNSAHGAYGSPVESRMSLYEDNSSTASRGRTVLDW